jgi:quercetin dioxygenase-like cupin family protein
MTRTLIALAVCCVPFFAWAEPPAALPSVEDGQVAHLKDAKWSAPKLTEIPAGVLTAPIAGDAKTGPSVSYAKFPAGYTFPAHWHTQTEYVTVVSGKVRFTVEGKAYDLVAGSYVVIPGKAHHQLTCGSDGECLIVSRRAGAVDYHFDK